MVRQNVYRPLILLFLIIILASSSLIPSGTVKYCTSPNTLSANLLARRIDISLQQAFAASGETRIAFYLFDKTTGVVCTKLPHWHTQSASIIKVSILSALLWQRNNNHQWLSNQEQQWARASINYSDNHATALLWNALGKWKALKAFYHSIGMNETLPQENRGWGMTQITAYDQIKLLNLLTTPQAFPEKIQNMVLNLMRTVTPSQRWGISAGASPNSVIAIKNGWLLYHTDYWRIHSIGNIINPAHDYQLAIISDGSRDMSSGVQAIERVAMAINNNMKQTPPLAK